MDREPAVAGSFYRADAAGLSAEVDRYLAGGEQAPALGLLVPHAGYVYSGAIAGAGYARVRIPKRAVVMGPNHTGLGAEVALFPAGCWHTPLGDVAIDDGLTAELSSVAPIELDATAHRFEHAIEVQAPFLLRAQPDIRIAALCLSHLSFTTCERLAEGIARATTDPPALLVASSDMSHYLPADVAQKLDARALDCVLALDAKGLYETVRRDRITMCGIIPATVMLLAARLRGAKSAELVRYGHSGEVNGDNGRVVGYAAVTVR